jgi:predicted nicotinamide N-methyase
MTMMAGAMVHDAEAFIRRHLELRPAPSVPEISLYAAHPASRLGRLPGGGEPPYWAYHWAGGSALARHILDNPDVVSSRTVIDLGCGSGIVAIAAAKGGASLVTAIDTDRYAVAATALNAQANGVVIDILQADILDDPPPPADLILAGDLFYNRKLARRTLPFLQRCRAAGISVLIGDPGRKTLPRSRLTAVAEYRVADFGEGETSGGIYMLVK